MYFASRRRGFMAAASIVASLALPKFALANTPKFPSKPITLVVAQGPGSGSDVVARLVAQYMGEALGQPVVVENKTGAGGIIAHQFVKRAPADGYTVLLSSTAHLLVLPEINESAKFSLDDFAPVGSVMDAPFAVLVPETEGAPKSIKALVDALKSQPGAYASAGVGTMTHLGSEVFLNRAGVKANHIPYKGSGAALTDLIGGQVTFATDSLTAAMVHLKSGRLRALAVTGAQREKSLPDVPTLAQAGYPGESIGVIGGIFAPKGVEQPVLDTLKKALDKALTHPELVARLTATETSVLRVSNEELLSRLRRQQPMWRNLIGVLQLKSQ